MKGPGTIRRGSAVRYEGPRESGGTLRRVSMSGGFQPSAAPWLLMCPIGDLHIICDRQNLSKFIAAHPELGDRNVEALLGLIRGSGGKHVNFWQNAKLMSWIERIDGTCHLPILGGRGKGGLDYFISMVAKDKVRNCSTPFEKSGLQQMFKVKGKTYLKWRSSEPPDNLHDWWSAASTHVWGTLPAPVSLIDFGTQSVGVSPTVCFSRFLAIPLVSGAHVWLAAHVLAQADANPSLSSLDREARSRMRPEVADQLRACCCCCMRSCVSLTEPWSCPTDCDFSLAAVASRSRLKRSILEYVILAGSLLSRTKTLAAATRCIAALSTLRTLGPALKPRA